MVPFIMFTLDPRQSYVMPAHFGPRYIGEKTSGWYRDVTVMAVTYLTDPERLKRYLPAPFELAEEALVTVYYACNKQVDWLAGHGYNMLGVNAAVSYQGEKEQLQGSYALVIWENLTDPILSGREIQGIPKVYADIPEHAISPAGWSGHASHFGHKFIDLSIGDLTEVPLVEAQAQQQQQKDKDHPMAWRYMPALGGFGEPVVNELATYPSENIYTKVMLGQGHIEWHESSWEKNPTQNHIINALAELPVLEYRQSTVTMGSTNLVLPERWTRTLV